MSEQHLWNQIKDTLQKTLQEKLLKSVLDTVTLESQALEGKKHFTLKVPSSFHQEILQKHLFFIQTQIKNKEGAFPAVDIQKQTPILSNKILKDPPPFFFKPPHKNYKKITKNSTFYPQWTFSSFIQGSSNSFAYSLAKSIAERPFNNNSNPLFIYGPSGHGKTHLLHAIGNRLEKEKPHLKVLYLPAERFFNDCINHIRKNEMEMFRQKYRKNIQVLLLDDIQILGKGESIQDEFFHTFESLKSAKCQLVLASDQKPKDIKGLKNRIKTRFEGGVIADIQTPDKDTKKAIIKSKALNWQTGLPEEVLSYISHIPTNSIREIEGHLNKVKMFCDLQNKALCLEVVQHLFCKEIPSLPSPLTANSPSFSKNSNFSLVLKEVCAYFHIKASELKSSSRAQHIVYARNIAIYLARKDLNLSLKELGYLFGNRNHSTILHSLKVIEKKKPKITSDLKELRKLIHKKIFPVKNL
ncbi:MAG: chromosomal replication initiator protein DnaA [Bdellovibrionales bacterium]|nr:chromosomal replication initiator protein DnaA [Bdellovibrionales bacterium]